MSKYIVQDTHIKHGAEGKKTAHLYDPGDEIELTEKEAKALGANVKPAPTKDKKDEKQTPVKDEKKDEKKEGSKPGGKK